MLKDSSSFKVVWPLLFALLGVATDSALANTGRASQLDNWCAKQPMQLTAPQQSRPYLASGNSCLTCHTGSPSGGNVNGTVGNASRSCSGSGAATTCGTSVNPFCVAHAPTGVSITAPPAGTSVAQGNSLTFTGATAGNLDNFPLTYTWAFSSGQPNATGQSVAVPMTVAGSVTSTLQVRNSNGMLATGTAPTRTVTVTAAGPPALTAAPTSLTFIAQAGGAAPAAQSVSVTSNGAQVALTATMTTTSGGSWLTVAPATSNTPSTLSVSVAPGSLTAGTYSGTVSIASAGASNSPRTVAVTFTVTAVAVPTIAVAPTSLTFTAQAGAAAPAAKTLSVTSSGAQVALTNSATTTSGGSWLTVTPATSTTPSTLSVSVNPGSLAAGTYSGTVSVASTGASNSPRTVAVTFTVTSGALPTLTVAPTSLTFSVQVGGAAPPAQSVSVTSSGAQVNLSATRTTTTGGNWLSVAPAASTTPSTLSVTVNPSGLAVGTYGGTVSIASTGVSNSPRTLAVTFTVTPAGPVATIVTPAINVSVLPGGRVTFGAAVPIPGSPSLTYRWIFPGGSPSSSSVRNPGSVTFRRAGTFTVTLTVTDNRGTSAPATVVITVARANQGAPSLTCRDDDGEDEHEDD